MTTIVTISNKNTQAIISQTEFNNKRKAMSFIAEQTIAADAVVFGNFKKTGKNFFCKYGNQ